MTDDERRFPIQSTDISSIPWAMIAPHRAQAHKNHSQSLERLAERGGLDPYEANLVLADSEWTGCIFVLPADRKIRDEFVASETAKLIEHVARWRYSTATTPIAHEPV